MKILVADKFPADRGAALRDLGHDVTLSPGTSADELAAAVAAVDPHVLVVRSTRVGAEAIEAGRDLSLVVRAGAGVNTIDLAAASRHGVFVSNCPGLNAIAVAELTMGLLLAIDRRIPDAVAETRAGRWNKKEYGKADGLFGKRLGLVGVGAIGREVASRARAFGMVVSAWTPQFTDDRARRLGVARSSSLDDLLRDSDVVSVHVPGGPATHHLLGPERLALLRPRAIVLHTARGGVVDDEALRAAVAAGRLRAGVDVFEGEPGGSEGELSSALAGTAGVYGTPHIGASTDQAESAIADEVVRIVRDYGRQGVVHNAVNLVGDRPERHAIVVRHLDRVGVLAAVLAALRREQLNVKEMQNVVFVGNEAACATITVERAPSPALLTELRTDERVIAVDLRSPE